MGVGGTVDRHMEGGAMRGELLSPELGGGQRTEMECGSGHEARRCISSGFSWGSWLLGWGEEGTGEGVRCHGCGRGRGTVCWHLEFWAW